MPSLAVLIVTIQGPDITTLYSAQSMGSVHVNTIAWAEAVSVFSALPGFNQNRQALVEQRLREAVSPGWKSTFRRARARESLVLNCEIVADGVRLLFRPDYAPMTLRALGLEGRKGYPQTYEPPTSDCFFRPEYSRVASDIAHGEGIDFFLSGWSGTDDVFCTNHGLHNAGDLRTGIEAVVRAQGRFDQFLQEEKARRLRVGEYWRELFVA